MNKTREEKRSLLRSVVSVAADSYTGPTKCLEFVCGTDFSLCTGNQKTGDEEKTIGRII